METFIEIVNQVTDLIGKTDTNFVGKVKDWVNARHDEVCRKTGWKDLIRSWSASSVANQAYIPLPQDIRIITAVYDPSGGIYLSPTAPITGARVLPGKLEVAGTTPNSYWIEETSVLLQPAAAGTITAESSEATDTSQTVRMRGRTASGEHFATATLNGTSTVNLLASCTQVDQVSKSAATDGFITFKDGSGNTLAVIYPRERTSRYKRIHLVQIPASVIAYTIYGKRRVPKLEFDEDVPVVDCWTALVTGAYAMALKQQRRFSQAQIEEQRFQDLLLDMIAEQDILQENVPQPMPELTRYSIDV